MTDEERRPLSFLGAAAWTIGVVLLLDVAVSVTEALRPGAITDLVSVTACHVLSYSIVVFAMLRVYAPETPVRRVVALRTTPPLWTVLAGAIGAGVYPALNVVDMLVARRYPQSKDDIERFGRLMTASTLGRRVFLATSLLVLMPVAEEVFFRGVLFGGLERQRKGATVIFATALYFAVARADVPSFASVLALGLVLGWLRSRSGSIVPPIVAQAAFFAVPLVPILRGADPTADEVYAPRTIAGALVLAAVSAALLEWRASRQPPRSDGEDG